jgi:hypothetical protein
MIGNAAEPTGLLNKIAAMSLGSAASTDGGDHRRRGQGGDPAGGVMAIVY